MVKEIILTDTQAARLANSAAWERFMGRKKRAEDVTDSLFQMVDNTDGTVSLIVPDEFLAGLTAAQRSRLRERTEALR